MTFGGGYAMLPMFNRELVEKKHYATEEEILDYYAIGQCTPGVIAVNTSTFIGYKKAGYLGALASTLGMVTPSLIIILILAIFIKQFAHIELVQYIFAGIRVAVAAMITDTVFKLCKKSVNNVYAILLFASAFAGSAFLGINTVIIVAATIFLGIIVTLKKAKQ